jgi:hypothetical protein
MQAKRKPMNADIHAVVFAGLEKVTNFNSLATALCVCVCKRVRARCVGGGLCPGGCCELRGGRFILVWLQR